MNIIVREYSPDDLHALPVLLRELGYPSTLAEMEDRMNLIGTLDNCRTIVAETDGLIVGILGMCKLPCWELNGSYYKIQILVTKAEFRRNGIGRLLLSKAEEIAAEQGALHLSLSCALIEERTAAHLFYPALGYEKRSYTYRKRF